MKLELSRQIFKKSSNIKFHANPSSGIRHTNEDRQKRLAMIMVAFRTFDIALIKTNTNTQTHTVNTDKCHCRIHLLEVLFNCDNNTSVDAICHTISVLTSQFSILLII